MYNLLNIYKILVINLLLLYNNIYHNNIKKWQNLYIYLKKHEIDDKRLILLIELLMMLNLLLSLGV